jgi:hypothetical protein
MVPVSDELHFTLAAVVAELRRLCATPNRETGDVQRNAILWLSVRAGVPADRSSFRLPAVALDISRLSQTPYLAAVGFLRAAGFVVPGLNRDEIVRALESLAKRNPHTVEGGGFADDPLWACGLSLLAHSFSHSVISVVPLVRTDRATAPPLVALLEALTDAGSQPAMVVVDSREGADLAAAVLASRIDPNLAQRLFDATMLRDAEHLLHQGLCRGSFQLTSDLSSMAVLAALETTPPSNAEPKTPVIVEPMRKVTILFLAANPGSTDKLALDEEVRDIEAKIRAATYRDSLSLKTRWAVRADDLLHALNEDKPTVVHFSGHGAGQRGIVLHDDLGGELLVPGAALRRLFSAVKDDIRLVVLSACYSSDQAREIAGVIDCVVGMKQSIDDDAARKFSAAFYRAVGFGRSIANAFDQGLAALALEGLPDEDVPELFVRPGVDASHVLMVEPAQGV